MRNCRKPCNKTWYVANELGFIQSLSNHKKSHSALPVLCCALSTGLTFTRHCRAPIKCYNTQSFFPPNSVNTVCTLLLSFTLSHDSSAGDVTWGQVPWLDGDSPRLHDYWNTVDSFVWIYAFPHTDSPSICKRSAGMATKGTRCANSGAALGKRQLLWHIVPTVLLWDHWESIGRQTEAERQEGHSGTMEALSSLNR